MVRVSAPHATPAGVDNLVLAKRSPDYLMKRGKTNLAHNNPQLQADWSKYFVPIASSGNRMMTSQSIRSSCSPALSGSSTERSSRIEKPGSVQAVTPPVRPPSDRKGSLPKLTPSPLSRHVERRHFTVDGDNSQHHVQSSPSPPFSIPRRRHCCDAQGQPMSSRPSSTFHVSPDVGSRRLYFYDPSSPLSDRQATFHHFNGSEREGERTASLLSSTGVDWANVHWGGATFHSPSPQKGPPSTPGIACGSNFWGPYPPRSPRGHPASVSVVWRLRGSPT